MQCATSKDEGFRPIELTITIESLNDLKCLYIMSNALQGCFTDEYWEECNAEDYAMNANEYNGAGQVLWKTVEKLFNEYKHGEGYAQQ